MGPPKCGAPGNCPVCPPLKPALVLTIKYYYYGMVLLLLYLLNNINNNYFILKYIT